MLWVLVQCPSPPGAKLASFSLQEMSGLVLQQPVPVLLACGTLSLQHGPLLVVMAFVVGHRSPEKKVQQSRLIEQIIAHVAIYATIHMLLYVVLQFAHAHVLKYMIIHI